MWWLWITLIAYLGIGIGVSIWLKIWEDVGFLGFLLYVIFMPLPYVALALYDTPIWIYRHIILYVFSRIKDDLKDRSNPEEVQWRKWEKQYYKRQK